MSGDGGDQFFSVHPGSWVDSNKRQCGPLGKRGEGSRSDVLGRETSP